MPRLRVAVALLAASAAMSVATTPGAATAATASASSTASAASGASGASVDVASYQRRLNRLGCDAGRADGVLDAHARDALRRFQSRHGRRMTGRLDQTTRRLLRSDTTSRCDQRPVPAHSGAGRRIVVSQHQDWIWLVRADGSVALQGGMVDAPSVLRPGRYATGSYCGRAARIAEDGDASGRYWLDHFVRFAPCGIGFHRIPRLKSTGRQIHPDWVLGTDEARSHGCLRVSREMADRIWRFAVIGTRVRVL